LKLEAQTTHNKQLNQYPTIDQAKPRKKIMTFKQKSNHYPKLKKQKQSRVDGKKTKKQLK
jgi:hypothetical protein